MILPHTRSSSHHQIPPEPQEAATAAVANLTSTTLSVVPAHTSTSKVLRAAVNTTSRSTVYVADLSQVARQVHEFRSLLPGVTPYYAVKCNPDPVLVSFLARIGLSFDCASTHEISFVSSLLPEAALVSDRVIYANPFKAVQDLSYARRLGISLMTFDTIDELQKIAHHFPQARLLLRIAVEDSHAVCPLSSKFGARLDEIQPILNSVKCLRLNLVGVAFHVGSGCTSVTSYINALNDARNVFESAIASDLPPLHVLDIGGGFPAHDGEAPITFCQIAQTIQPILATFTRNHVQVIAEPGRFIAGSAYSLAAKVVLVEDYGHQPCYYLDQGVYGSFRDAWLLDYQYPVHVLCNGRETRSDNACSVSTLRGPSRDHLDVIARNIKLPILDVGAWLYFPNMGAYTMSLSTTRCKLEQSDIIYYFRVHSEDGHGHRPVQADFAAPKAISSVV